MRANHHAHRAGGIVTLAAVGAVVLFAVLMLRQPWALAALTEPRTSQLMKLGLKFGGEAGCTAAKCHGAATAAKPPDHPGNECAVWSAKDKHSKAYNSLTNDEGKKIAAAMGIADASKDTRCTTCHTIDLDKFPTLKGDKYSKEEGVSCTACHGPDERWEKPHQDKGWTDKTRQQFANDPQKMLAGWGLYDTKSPVMCAEMCSSCHLAIDAELVSKGKHPQPKFELEYYSAIQPKHWREADGFEKVRRWAVGQAVCVRDAMRQLGERAKGGDAALTKDGYQQAMAHLSLLRAAMTGLGTAAPNLDAHATALAAAMGANDNAKLASEADATASDAEAAFNAANALAPAAGSTAKLAQSIASDATMAQQFGAFGMEQQAYALYALYSGYSVGAGKAPDRAVVGKIIALMPQPKKPPMAADQFAAGLAAVKAALPAE